MGKLDDDSTERHPQDSIVSLPAPITTLRTVSQDQERALSLYFTLANFTKVIKKLNQSQSYTLLPEHAIEIVNFFFGTVFHPSGAKMVELMIKEYSKDTNWKGYESSRRYSGLATTHQAIRDIHLAYRAEEFILEKNKKTRRRTLRAMELSVEFYQAYSRGSRLLKGEDLDTSLLEYMPEL